MISSIRAFGILGVATLVVLNSSNAQDPPESADKKVFEALKAVHMEDRLQKHYEGGDIGAYLSQFSFQWSDDAMVLAWSDFRPFVRFFDSLRAAAKDKNLKNHSPITNGEMGIIFWEAFPDEEPLLKELYRTKPPWEGEVSVERFFEVVDQYRDRVPTNPKGESGRNGD